LARIVREKGNVAIRHTGRTEDFHRGNPQGSGR
jgi:hypothetical protein